LAGTEAAFNAALELTPNAVAWHELGTLKRKRGSFFFLVEVFFFFFV